MSQLVADYLIATCPDVDITSALSIMPLTQSESSFPLSLERLVIRPLAEGMDLNPVFTSATSFRAIGDELNLFKQARIQLVHGWLVDPESPEAAIINKAPDYDSAANFIAHADHTSKGRLVVDEDLPPNFSGPSKIEQNYNPDERERIENGPH
jgi:hypothetical protein